MKHFADQHFAEMSFQHKVEAIGMSLFVAGVTVFFAGVLVVLGLTAIPGACT